MPAHHQSKSIPWTGIGIAIIGILFCLYLSSEDGKFLCVTSGCALNKTFSIAGISAWLIGAAAFAAYAVCGLVLGRKAARPLATAFLVGDSLFLLLMGMTLPCVPCLIAGSLFALLFAATGDADKYRAGRSGLTPALGIWGILFLLNLLLVFKEFTAPAPMFGSPDAPIKIYFSPSCPACRDAVRRYGKEARSGTAALYPVAEDDRDMLIIESMQNEAARGSSPETALADAMARPAESMPFRFRTLALYWRLWANKAVTFSLGNGQVPLIIYNGLPVLTPHENGPGVPSESGANAPLTQEANAPLTRANESIHADPMDIFDAELRNCGGQNGTEDCGTP